jgi:t-SNARE complex subunit (syntaxin)
MWKALLQFRAFLPYIARLLEMSSPTQQSTALTTELRSEMRQSVGSLEASHRDLRLAVQDQTVEIKRIEESIARTREAAERNTGEVTELAEDVRSMRSLVKVALGILVLLFVTLIGLVIFLLFKVKPLLH